MSKIDDAQRLLARSDFEGVLSLLKDENDSLSLIYRLTSLIALSRFDDAIYIINKYQKQLEEEVLPNLIDIHVTILRSKLDVVGLMKAKEHYNDLPYHSQVVEEKLRNFDNIIQKTVDELARKDKALTIEDTKKLISSEDMNEVYEGIKALDSFNFLEVLPFILDSLINLPYIFSRSALLIYLGERDYNFEVDYKNNINQIVKVNPKEMMKYHSKERSDIIIDQVAKYLDKDISLINVARSIYTLYEMTIMPDYIKEDDEIFFEGLAHLTKQYMNIDENASKVVMDMANEIKDAIILDEGL